jgi:ABC-type bacteriocin/lantibiotic exporter with double-glycine peptidase domain
MDKYRRQIGVVSQRIHLFSGKILDNIKLWDDNITELEINHILKKYDLTGFLENEKYKNLSISESGKNLSGGQVQEIALIRAILRKPSLYIFDEPTSNLDRENRNKFIGVINKIENDLCIIITHDEELISKIEDREGQLVSLIS